jgi:hypothetical protein
MEPNKLGAPKIHVVQCVDTKERDCFFALLTTTDKIRTLRQEAIQKPDLMDITPYGAIVASGFGKKIPYALCQSLEKEYNVDLARYQSTE